MEGWWAEEDLRDVAAVDGQVLKRGNHLDAGTGHLNGLPQFFGREQ
jgi:hypothetical protein